MDWKAAKSCQSKAEYLHSVADSFFEKKPRGRQPFTSYCWRTPPMWVSEAMVARGSRCASGVAAARAALMESKDCCRVK